MKELKNAKEIVEMLQENIEPLIEIQKEMKHINSVIDQTEIDCATAICEFLGITRDRLNFTSFSSFSINPEGDHMKSQIKVYNEDSKIITRLSLHNLYYDTVEEMSIAINKFYDIVNKVNSEEFNKLFFGFNKTVELTRKKYYSTSNKQYEITKNVSIDISQKIDSIGEISINQRTFMFSKKCKYVCCGYTYNDYDKEGLVRKLVSTYYGI